ncbi:SPOC like C-terminal domain-containing protein [Vararia minispora EC-137]|uniref:SPOC like C-terminal domain-containing protein n=1 Tax=Vararia minispora EC-137 TaxID=1314806 RepID=A0ACB8QCS3_9AGAM|nr:SPOC like C-terminal domain-containing protein [Vararia minispora EC-137]
MGQFDDWSKLDEDEEQELYDQSLYETRRDVILFCIDCSQSMLSLYEDPVYEDIQSCHVRAALEAAVQISKKKVLVGPNDSIGIILYNVASPLESEKHNESGEGTEPKRGTYVYQRISQINAEKVIDLNQIIDGTARHNPELLKESFPPTEKKVPMGDVFTSCNWVMRDDAPKAASKRVFLITDDDDPHPGAGRERFVVTARTTLVDLVQSGITVEPFFISTDEKPFDRTKFWSDVLLPTTTGSDADSEEGEALPESLSMTRVNDLLAQMRFYEVPKRAHFSISLKLAESFVIGVKGYSLVVEQKKGAYKYFADLGDRMEVADSKMSYFDDEKEHEVDKDDILYGMTLGATAEDEDSRKHGFGSRVIDEGSRVFYTAEEVKSFRTLGLSPGLKLLGFKKRKELKFEDNVKHSVFIFPSEASYSGSKRTFSALIQAMLKKKRIALLLGIVRSNSQPTFYAGLPQAEVFKDDSWVEPAGMHLIPLPFADDIREAPVREARTVSSDSDLVQAARPIVRKLELKGGAYVPESYPNPALAFHNAQLEASAFRDEFDRDSFEDLTLPQYDRIHKARGLILRTKLRGYVGEWKELLENHPSVNEVVVTAGMKRKADVSVNEAEIRSKYESGGLVKLRVDQLKEFLRSKGESASGRKSELLDQIAAWIDAHP